MAREIPVYLFVGFLESGKTKFIQETFEDPNFDSGDKTLLLVCEEGEEEFKPQILLGRVKSTTSLGLFYVTMFIRRSH